MKPLVFTFLVCVLFFNRTQAQSKFDTTAAINQRLKIMCDAVNKKDFKTFIKCIYPKLVQITGGAAKMEGDLKKSFGDSSSKDGANMSVSTGNPSKIILAGKEWQCTIPETIKMIDKNGDFVRKSTLIAISSNARDWYFIDTNNIPVEVIRAMFPNISINLVIPEATSQQSIQN